MTTETEIASPAESVAAAPLANESVGEQAPSENAFEWQRFWIRLEHTPWTTLAVVPVDAGIDVHSIANQLVAAGRQAGSQVVSSFDAVGMPASRAQEMALTLGQSANRRVVIACDPLSENPATLALSRAVSGVLLVARLGESRISVAKAAVDAIGRERIIASVTLERAR